MLEALKEVIASSIPLGTKLLFLPPEAAFSAFFAAPFLPPSGIEASSSANNLSLSAFFLASSAFFSAFASALSLPLPFLLPGSSHCAASFASADAAASAAFLSAFAAFLARPLSAFAFPGLG